MELGHTAAMEGGPGPAGPPPAFVRSQENLGLDTPSTSGSQQDHEALLAEKVQRWHNRICERMHSSTRKLMAHLRPRFARGGCCPCVMTGLATVPLTSFTQPKLCTCKHAVRLIDGTLSVCRASCMPEHACFGALEWPGKCRAR